MKVERNMVVEIVYDMKVDGETVEKCTEGNPFGYIHGTGSLLKGFERRLEGMESGQEFAFELPAAEGHGEFVPERVIEVPREAFVIDGEFREDLIRKGNVIPLMGADGVVVRGTIVEVGESGVTIDTNNRFAGKGMSFSGKVLSVREATEKELAEGLHGELVRHGCGGCHGGGCHGGHHDDGCGEGCGEGCGHHDEGEGRCKGSGEGCCGQGGCREK